MAASSRLCDPTFRLPVTEATQTGADGDIDRGVVYSLKSVKSNNAFLELQFV